MSEADKEYSIKEFEDAVIKNDNEKMMEIFQAQVSCSDSEWLNGYIPLYLACQYGRFSATKKFLDADAIRVNNCVRKIEDTALHWAVFHSTNYDWDVKTVEKLVKKGADMNLENLQRQNAFDIALRIKNFSVLEILINNATDNNIEERTYLKLLLDLMDGDHVKFVELLLTKCSSIDVNKSKLGVNYLAYAVQKRQHGVIRSFLKRGVDVDYCNEFSKPKTTALFTACEIGDLESVKILLDSGANMDIKGYLGYSEFQYPITIAVARNHVDIVRELLDRGENIYKKNPDCCETLLQLACRVNDLGMVKLLLERGADVNFDNDDDRESTAIQTALDCPSYRNNKQEGIFEYILGLHDFQLSIKDVKYITFRCNYLYYRKQLNTLLKYIKNLHPQDQLRYDLDVLVLNNDNFTRPLIHYATRHSAFPEILVENDTDVDLKDRKGRTALHVAFRYQLLGSIRVLIQSGADINVKCNAGLLPVNHALDEKIRESRYDTEGEFGESSDSEGENDEEEIVNYYCCHVKKLKYLGHFVNNDNNNFASKNLNDPLKYEKKYKEELEMMRKEVISSEIPYITYYDFVTGNLKKRINLIYNPQILAVLNNYKNYKKKFPEFADVISNLYHQALPRKKLLDKFNECKISEFLYKYLPGLCVEEIYSYFSNKELKDVVNMFTFFDK